MVRKIRPKGVKIVESLKATCTVVQRCCLGHLKHHHVSGLGAWHDGSTRWCHLLHNLLVVQRTLKLKTDERCSIMLLASKTALPFLHQRMTNNIPMPKVITHTHHNYIFNTRSRSAGSTFPFLNQRQNHAPANNPSRRMNRPNARHVQEV